MHSGEKKTLRRWRPLDAVQRHFRRSRPGSVLILVVALLVLLALLGTAYINTSQTDRYSSAQNSFNTEVDLLIQGLQDLTQAAVDNALFGTNTNKAFHGYDTTTTTPAQYALADYPTGTSGMFIADRYPTVPNLTAAATNIAGGNAPIWNFVSALPTNTTFDSPYINTAAAPYPTQAGTYQTRSQMTPLSLSWSITDSAGPRSVTYPALGYYAGSGAPTYYVALAADADGDGIADAPLFRLPIGELNGVTYYGGVRIIDNAAAVNAAIAWQSVDPTTVMTGIPGNFYPTNIDLNGLLVTGDALTNLNTWRFGNQSAPSLTPIDERSTPPSGGPPPTPPATVSRADFAFGNSYEAFWMQLGRRIANPGYITLSAPYQALSVGESQSLAHRFILRDTSPTSATLSSSILEQDLSYSTFGNPPTASASLYRSTAYAADQAVNWYNSNFDFVTGNMPLRSMLVTQNGVSNFTPSKIYGRGSYVANTYNFGDWVLNPADNRAYVCLQNTTTAPDPTNPSSVGWEREPWATAPIKVSANTATFGQLWIGYFSAMAKPVTTLPAPAAAACTTAVVPTAGTPQNAMFRSPLRTPLTPAAGMTAPEAMQLRAALAAIDTLDLRDSDDDVTSRQIMISDATGAPVYKVMVYGLEKQPYITEVYASDGTSSYVAVELFNPYSAPITLTNWQLAYTPRTAGAALNFTQVTGTTAWSAMAPTIPAGGYIVLVGTNPPPTGLTTPTGTNVYQVSGLESAIGNELFLLKPRLASGVVSPASAVPTNVYNEATPTGAVTDLVPVDSYDFTGLSAIDMPAHAWHYVRPNDVTQLKAWHWVYPGLYDHARGTSGDDPRLTATDHGPAPLVATLGTLGVADATSPKPFIDRPLQVANRDFGGPKSIANYPYGAFARNADLLQVTYIGAYRVEDLSGNIIELNPVTMDSAMANDPNLDDDTYSEQIGRQSIGRFCQVHWADTLKPATQQPLAKSEVDSTLTSTLWDDYIYAFVPTASMPTQPVYWPKQTAYQWTLDLFDYLTVQAPHDDYLPDADPLKYALATPVANASYLAANAGYANPTSTASTNYPASATEETVPVHGRVNINTANWRVLATLPMLDGATYGASPNATGLANIELAQAIVYYRDIDDGTTAPTPHPHGAFQSIDELNNVVVPAAIVTGTSPLPAGTCFRNVLGYHDTSATLFNVAGVHGTNAEGDLSPFNSGSPTAASGDMVYGDFENQNLALTRISNLITTRSDSFTAYIIVQGWRNAGTKQPQLVVQRRAAFMIDRSGITPANTSQPVVTNIPSN